MHVHLVTSPRSRSTALLYAFGRRGDAHVVDEPFYAFYLAHSGAAHPGRADVLAFQPTGARAAVDQLRARLAGASEPHAFVKDMAHHLQPLLAEREGEPPLPEARRVYLVRDPRDAIPSFAAVHPHPTVADIGLADLHALWLADWAARRRPIVIDADDLASTPEATLRTLCDALGLRFVPGMTSWPAEYRPDPVPWSEHWYTAVEASGGLAPQRSHRRPLPPDCGDLLAGLAPLYTEMRAERLKVALS